MKSYLTIFYILLAISCETSYAQDNCILKGKWKSNVERTKIEIEKSGKYSSENINKLLEKVFGKLVIDYTCTSYTSYYDGDINEFNYKVTNRSGNTVTIEFSFGEDNELVQETLLMDPDGECYSLLLEGMGYKEVFCKIK